MLGNLVSNLVAMSVQNLILSSDRDMLFGNLELEDGNDYLLEDGAFILLE